MRNVTLSVWPHRKSCSIHVGFVVSGADRVDASTCPSFQALEYVCFFVERRDFFVHRKCASRISFFLFGVAHTRTQMVILADSGTLCFLLDLCTSFATVLTIHIHTLFT